MHSELLTPLLSSPKMQSILADDRRMAAMLAFESALARAEALAGIVPRDAAATIGAACGSFKPDIASLAAATRLAGNPAIPFVKALTAHCPEPGKAWVHWGATSQDVVDTASALVLREGIGHIDGQIQRLGDGLATLAETHRSRVMPGRTLLQPALPITFGFKVAGWLDMVTRCRGAVLAAADAALVLHFGGAVGTLAAIGEEAESVRAALGRELGLPVPAVTSHTARDRFARLGMELAILTGALAKIAGDIALLMQAEIGEASEPAAPGRGGSSTMPQKRNPVATVVVRAAALRANGLAAGLLAAIPQEHERGAGGWHAEWALLPDLFDISAGALEHMAETIAGLEVRPDRMRENLDTGSGTLMSESLMMALAPEIGRAQAHHLVQQIAEHAISQQRTLRDVAMDTEDVAEVIGIDGIEKALDPASYLGIAEATVDAAIRGWRVRQG
ncbi:3-carboxy-cis,cis-muconate cycloisomerase [Microbaculum marinum]|uniref:3-carboxy-cis,cis-muconate cycloisomerase n=1 Tax=Microbaculum marinum TaxID=1764581 RepID=A0AAW9RWD3_9HYPH